MSLACKWMLPCCKVLRCVQVDDTWMSLGAVKWTVDDTLMSLACKWMI